MEKTLDLIKLPNGHFGLPAKAKSDQSKPFSNLGGWIIFAAIMTAFLLAYL